MRITNLTPNTAVRKELGERVRDNRIASGLSQEELADKAGISVSSLHRLEAGGNASLDCLLLVLRALDCLENANLLLTEQGVSPQDYIDHSRKEKRKRAPRVSKAKEQEWKWGDEK